MQKFNTGATYASFTDNFILNISLSQAIPKPVRVDHFFNGVRVRHAQSASFFLRICSFQPLHLLLWHFLSGASSNFTSCMPRKREYCVWNSLHIAANRILLVPSCPTVVQQLPSLALSAQVRCATLSGRCHTASPRLTLLASNTWRLDLDPGWVGSRPHRWWLRKAGNAASLFALLGGPGGVLEWAPAAVWLVER